MLNDTLVEFIINNYKWIMIISAVLLMILIGYIADATDFGRAGKDKNSSKDNKSMENDEDNSHKIDDEIINNQSSLSDINSVSNNDNFVIPNNNNVNEEVIAPSIVSENTVNIPYQEPIINEAPISDTLNQVTDVVEESNISPIQQSINNNPLDDFNNQPLENVNNVVEENNILFTNTSIDNQTTDLKPVSDISLESNINPVVEETTEPVLTNISDDNQETIQNASTDIVNPVVGENIQNQVNNSYEKGNNVSSSTMDEVYKNIENELTAEPVVPVSDVTANSNQTIVEQLGSEELVTPVVIDNNISLNDLSENMINNQNEETVQEVTKYATPVVVSQDEYNDISNANVNQELEEPSSKIDEVVKNSTEVDTMDDIWKF